MGNEPTNRCKEPTRSTSSLSGPNASSKGVARCVLVAEDDPDDRFMLRRAWRKAGLPHRLIELGDGEQVIRYLGGNPPYDNREIYPLPDLLLLDLKMPKLNGFDILAWIQGRPDMRRLNVIILSSSSLDTDREFAVKLGAKAFFSKPDESSKLVVLVQLIHEYWLVKPTAFVNVCGNEATPTELFAFAGRPDPGY